MSRARRAWTRLAEGVAPAPAGAASSRPAPPRVQPRAGRSARALLAAIARTVEVDATIPERQFVAIDPVPAPRMTRRDVWNPRPCVKRYYAYREELQLRRVRAPHRFSLEVGVRMPDSWSESKKRAMEGQPKLFRGDADNFLKAFVDSVVRQDSAHWDGRVRQYWARSGYLLIEKATDDPAPRVGATSP